MKLYIKNMVSNRCKILVKSEIEKLGLRTTLIKLGEAEILDDITDEQLNILNKNLNKAGLAILNDKKSILIEKIKNIIIEYVHYTDERPRVNFSDYLSEKLNFDYTYMANIFSEHQNITIEHFIIEHKIERVKELLIYDELNLSEIADKLHYSSVAHLSNQFRKTTGLSPSEYKHLKLKKRQPLENV